MHKYIQYFNNISGITEIHPSGKLCINRDRHLKLNNPDIPGYSSNASCPLNYITMTESIPLLVDCEPMRVSSSQ